MSLLIRAMRADEAEAATDVFHRAKTIAHAWLPSEFNRTYEEDLNFLREQMMPKGVIWVAERNGAIVGVMGQAGAEINQLYVDPEHQRTGIGAALIEHAKQQSPQHLALYTLQQNKGACAFYEKHGFVAIRFGVSPPPESEPDVRYEWRPV